MTQYQDRIRQAQSLLLHEGLAGIVLAPSAQMRYLLGWAEPGHERLIALFVPAEGTPALLVPSINAEHALHNAAGVKDVRGWTDERGWQQEALALLSSWPAPPRGIAIDDELMSVHLLEMQSLEPGRTYTPAGPLMARLRQLKSLDEIASMRRSGEVTDSVYEESLGALREGMTEVDLQEAIGQAYRKRGTRADFALVCFGPNGAMPHHHSGDRSLRRGDVVVLDIGCTVGGYASDITRTVAFGSPDGEARRVYDVVYQAHRAAVSAGRPGVTCEAIDAAARDVIARAGYGEAFIHRTGHGIGLSGHEPPYIVAGNTQPLQVGMCFSIEPGIYLPGRFGVRVENIVTVGEDGLRYLNADPPDHLIVMAE